MEGDPRVDDIMMEIDKHIIQGPFHVHHFNRTYEAIWKWLDNLKEV